MGDAAINRPKAIGEISSLGQRYLAGELRQHRVSAEILPSREGDLHELRSLDEAQAERWFQRGLEEVRKGSVVYGLLAAGASSRMDLTRLPERVQELLEQANRGELPRSKALVPVAADGGRVFTFLDLFLTNVARFNEQAGAAARPLLFVSELNRDELRTHIEREFDGAFASSDSMHEVIQQLEPQIVATAADVDRSRGNFDSDEDWRTAHALSERFAGRELEERKPAGHGEFLHQLIASGLAGRLLDSGVRYVSVRNIDNVPAVLDRPWLTLLGAMIEEQWELLVEVSKRNETQKGGALIRQSDAWRLAEDPSFAGSRFTALDSFYINNAVAILKLDYLFPIYGSSEDELRQADASRLAEIAEQGRRKFPTIVEAKPLTLAGGEVVGAVTPETNMWESTSVAEGAAIGAFAVGSESDVGLNITAADEAEQHRRANLIRFAPVKKWSDYNDVDKQTIIRHVAARILHERLL